MKKINVAGLRNNTLSVDELDENTRFGESVLGGANVKHQQYGGLDAFKFLAALLVVAIHTSPLSSFSLSADFLFTRVFARIAVPFFLMVTGSFLLRPYLFERQRDVPCVAANHVFSIPACSDAEQEGTKESAGSLNGNQSLLCGVRYRLT